jgi:hypothetical protein
VETTHKEQPQSVVFGEVGVVFEVEGCQGKVGDDATCGDPRVIRGDRTTAPLAGGRESPPRDGDLPVVTEDRALVHPGGESLTISFTPRTDLHPFRQLSVRHEGEGGHGTHKAGGKVAG